MILLGAIEIQFFGPELLYIFILLVVSGTKLSLWHKCYADQLFCDQISFIFDIVVYI